MQNEIDPRHVEDILTKPVPFFSLAEAMRNRLQAVRHMIPGITIAENMANSDPLQLRNSMNSLLIDTEIFKESLCLVPAELYEKYSDGPVLPYREVPALDFRTDVRGHLHTKMLGLQELQITAISREAFARVLGALEYEFMGEFGEAYDLPTVQQKLVRPLGQEIHRRWGLEVW